MNRHSIFDLGTPKREIVLMQSYPCIGKCIFCDYTKDNSTNTFVLLKNNEETISKITGIYSIIELANSGSVFEIPFLSLISFKNKCIEVGINLSHVDSRWEYRDRIQTLRDFFNPIKLRVNIGVETWNDQHRLYLGKNFKNFSHKECLKYFDGVYLMIGFNGQTEKDIIEDINKTCEFSYANINLYVNRTGKIKEFRDFNVDNILSKVPKHFEINVNPNDQNIGN